MSRPKPSIHRHDRQHTKKTKPHAIHKVNPAGTKFARRILQKQFGNVKAKEMLGI
jgi:hypothetical protein